MHPCESMESIIQYFPQTNKASRLDPELRTSNACYPQV